MRTVLERWADALRSLNAAVPGSFTAARALIELQRLEEEWTESPHEAFRPGMRFGSGPRASG